MDPRPQHLVLILADISGYTKFMLANQAAIVHGQMVITKLLEEIIREIEIPLEVSSIEGDAVFFYAIKPDDEAEWERTRKLIGRKLVSFFDAFARGILLGSEFALCKCPTCQNIDQLRLKIIVHSGQAILHHVGRFSEVSGVDVILAHRLLKNSIPSDEYVLMTESAHREIEFPTGVEPVRGEENYEGFGPIPTFSYLINGACAPKPEAVKDLYADRAQAFRTGLRMLAKGYFGQMPILFGLRPPKKFNDVDKLPVNPFARTAMALLEILLAPIILPYGALIQAHRTLTRTPLANRRPAKYINQ